MLPSFGMKRLFILVSIFIICGGGAYCYFQKNRGSGAEKALLAFKGGDFSATERILNSTQSLASPLSLYRSYLATAKGQFKESDYFLQTILRAPPQMLNEELLVQSYLISAINAYFENRDHTFVSLVEQAKNLESDTSVLMFFEGLTHYLEKNYEQAFRFWSALFDQGSWLDSLINHCFPNNWKNLHLAHCKAEMGDVLGSRELLENESHLLEHDPCNFRQLAILFLGLTYLKEAEEVPEKERSSYYKLAHFYFERSGREMRFDRERANLSAHLCQVAIELLSPSSSSEMKQWGVVFVRTLQEWNALDRLEEVITHLTQNILLRRDVVYHQLCKQICEEFHGGYFHTSLMEKLLLALKEEVRRKESDTMQYLWGVIESLADNPKQTARFVAHLVQEELFETIYWDSESLFHTRSFLAFWKGLKPDQMECEKLAEMLLGYGQVFWKKEGFEEKGNALLCLALDFSENKQLLQNKIDHFLSELYAAAESSNMVHRLSLIHDALEYFHITIKEIASIEKLANHLADAEYFYHVRNWAAAKTHADWVLKLDPDNYRARRLVGLACFYMGEYNKAMRHLSKLPIMDESTHKALAFSRIYCSQEKTEHLVQIDNIDSFDEDD